VSGFLYDGKKVVALLDANNQVVSRFVYGAGRTTPDYMVKGGVEYRIIQDHRGSPRLVVDSNKGLVVEQIDYDVYGNVLTDTNPGFQPFGLGGGLYDQDTKLVHFGARDYEPSTGRWTSKDPLRFSSGDTNLYAYVLNDPVNLVDPEGEQTRAAAEVVNPEASSTWSTLNSGLDTALKAIDAFFDKDLLNFVKGESLKRAKENIAPGPQKEVEKVLKEDEKTIPVIRDLVNGQKGTWDVVNRNVCPPTENTEQVKPQPKSGKIRIKEWGSK
jgi:RHS repeat-associated protein